MADPVVREPQVVARREGASTRRVSGRRSVEVCDLIVRYDGVTGERLDIRRDDAVACLLAAGDRRIAGMVSHLPADVDGMLDRCAVDAVLIRMHTQLQRLWEEVGLGEHVVGLVRPLVDASRAAIGDPARAMRVVDVGCGLGYLVRWAAATGAFGPGVEVVGCDFDASLVAEARRLAALERLPCRFEVSDALHLEGGADVYVSSGLLHHLGVDELPRFFARQAGAAGICHWDPAPSWLAPLGSWVFHRARMRDPLARHDGVRSVQRAHPDETLLRAVAEGLPTMATGLHGLPDRRLPVLDVIRSVVAVRPELAADYRARLGAAARRLMIGTGPW